MKHPLLRVMACECKGCSVAGCGGSASGSCGWPLGKKKRAIRRCHWCTAEEDEQTGGEHVTVPIESPCCPLREPLYLWADRSPRTMPSTVRPYEIPKVRHVSGPCWRSQLGGIKDHVQALQEKSAAHGWSLCYWSHEAMDAEMDGCTDAALRKAYFSIDPAYMVARSDLFRPWVLYTYGGMWLDLRGTPALDEEGIGLEAVPRHFNGVPPPLLFCNGGQHKEKLGGLHGEIMNGFMMSAPGLSIWRDVWNRAVDMISSYPGRWRRCEKPGQQTIDDTLIFFDVPVAMTGREGVLCMGPLSMTKVIYEYLDRHVVEECIPATFRNFWNWSALTSKRKSWANVQARLFYRDNEKAAAHRHYSKLTTPIVFIGDDLPMVGEAGLVLERQCFPQVAGDACLAGSFFIPTGAGMLMGGPARFRLKSSELHQISRSTALNIDGCVIKQSRRSFQRGNNWGA